MKLYLIRHGKTEANEKHFYCGSTDIPLTDAGIADLKELHYSIPEHCRYMTSGMLRTEQTLHHLFGTVAHTQDLRFREIDFGIFEMHSYEELKEKEDYQKWISGDNEANIPPDGESANAMQKRVIAGLEDLHNQNQDTVLITHGGVIAAIMAYLFPEEDKNRYSWQPNPGNGYLIEDNTYQKLGN